MNINRHPTLHWLAKTVASYLDVPVSSMEMMVPLADMGVGSVEAVGLVGDIEEHFDIDVDPTLIFDYPTLSHIADYIDSTVGLQETVA